MMGENQDNFYVTLFINSSMKVYLNNSVAAFTFQLAHEIVLSGKDAWEVVLCEFSCPPKTGTIAAYVVTGTTNAMVYCKQICPQFVGSKKVRCLRTFIHPSVYCNLVFENRYYLPLEQRTFRKSPYPSWTLAGGVSPSRIAIRPRRSSYISDAFLDGDI